MGAVIDYRGKTPRKTPSGIPLITAKIVKGGRIESPDEFIAEEDYVDWMRRGVPECGDVVVTTEAPLGEVAQLGNERVALAQRLICLRGKLGVLNNNFLKFLMQSNGVQEQLRSRATGTTVLGIKQKELRKVILTLPPLPEQKAIAHILGTLDDKIELNRRINQTLEAIAQALFQDWFVDFGPTHAKMEGLEPYLPPEMWDLFPDKLVDSELGEIPERWDVKPLGQIVDLFGGATPSTKTPDFWDGGAHCWATPKDLSTLSSPILLDTERKVTDAGLGKISSGLLPTGTLLMSSRAPIGYLAVSEVPVAINQGFIAMPPRNSPSNWYMLHWCRTTHDEIMSHANGSTFLEISKSNFRQIPMILPEEELLMTYDRVAETLYQRVSVNQRQSLVLAKQRDELIPKLLSGELQPEELEG